MLHPMPTIAMSVTLRTLDQEQLSNLLETTAPSILTSSLVRYNVMFRSKVSDNEMATIKRSAVDNLLQNPGTQILLY